MAKPTAAARRPVLFVKRGTRAATVMPRITNVFRRTFTRIALVLLATGLFGSIACMTALNRI
jgi:hypothetical protein